ncbi:MAG: hypothetical protein ACTHMS_02670, partial [Jatrophihabitans sp.]
MGARVAAAVATDLVALRLCRPHPRRVAWALHHLAADPDGALLELSRALAFATAAWLGLGLLLVVATAVPGRVGALARRAQLVVLPAAARRLLVGAVGVGLVASPAVASARTTPTPTAPAWPVATS